MQTSSLFHRLWTKAVGNPGYDKAEWKELESALLGMGEQLPQTKPALPEKSPAAFWAIVELYGHRRLAGRISEAAFPAGFVQIDCCDGPTKIYNEKAIYGLSPVTEQAARAAAAKCCDDPAPIKPWESGEAQRIEALRAALSKVARGDVSPAVDLAREALAADAALASTDEPPESTPLDDDDPEAW